MATVTITVSSIYDRVQLTLQGVPAGVTPYSIVDGTEASPEYYITPLAPFGTGLLTGIVLGNDEISIDGYTGTYYTVTVTDIRSLATLYQANFEITGTTYDLDTETPLT